MGWVPGWESIQATGWWSGFFFWASIVSLIGLGISEVASHRFAERKDELVERQQIVEKERHDTDIARVQHDAALAIERAAVLEKEAETARASIAAANARAAEASQKAAEAQLALEKFRAPRKLSSEQQTTIVGIISQFSGQKFDMAVNSGDPEAGFLLDTIESILTRAGWQQVDWKGGDIVFSRPQRPVIGIISMVGVFAQMERDKAQAFEAAAVMLMGSLNLEGIASKAEAGSIAAAENKDVMHIMVGKKP
jgi:hypothetical protein